MGGSSGGGGAFPVYQYARMPHADWQTVNNIEKLQADPSLENIYKDASQNLDYIPKVSSGFDPSWLVQSGAALKERATVLPTYAHQVAAMGLDPQNQIRDRLQRDMSNQTRSRLAGSGLANTPYGAGVEGSNLANFQNAWENNKLNRATQGAESASNLLQNYGGLTAAGVGLQAAAPTMQLGVSQSLAGLAGNYLAQRQQAIADWLQYLGQGTQANAVGAQAYEAAESRKQRASESRQSGLMQGLGLVGSILGGGK